MKKRFTLIICLFLTSLAAFAGKFVMIPVTETHNLETLFLNNDLKIHYYCDNYVLATADNIYYKGTIVLDDNAFADVSSYTIVYCYNDYKEEYLTKISKRNKVLFSGDHFLIMKILSDDFMPAKNDGTVRVTQRIASLAKKSADFPVVTEKHPFVQFLTSKVNTDTLMAFIQHLQDYGTRAYNEPEAYQAQDWLKSKFESFGLKTEIQDVIVAPYQYWGWSYYPHTNSSGNVIAVQPGKQYPNEYIVCGAHYDSWSWYPVSATVAPGADDNASGTATVLELARVLSKQNFERTIIYCCFAAEEFGLHGSEAYAQLCRQLDMNIVGYFNIDMSGYLKPNDDIHISLIYPSSATSLANFFINVADIYYNEIPITSYANLYGGDSDHTSFNQMGFRGIWAFEDWDYDSPYIHSPDDIIGLSVNNEQQVNLFTQINLASIATLAMYDVAMPPPNNISEKSTKLNIYPNPATTELRITSGQVDEWTNGQINKGLNPLVIEIFDIYGRKVATKFPSNELEGWQPQADEVVFNISHLQSGIYFIKTSNGIVAKFIKN